MGFRGGSDDDADDEERFEPATRAFDDSLSERLPIGYEDPVPHEGLSHPAWTRFVIRVPTRWPQTNPLQHVSLYLQAVHLPDHHRVHVFIKDLQVLRDNHHVVSW